MKRRRETVNIHEYGPCVVLVKCDALLHNKNLPEKQDTLISAPYLETEEILEAREFNNFLKTVLPGSENLETEETEEQLSEELQKFQLDKLLWKSSKLKSLGATKYVPRKNLLKLLNLFEETVSDGPLLRLPAETEETDKKGPFHGAMKMILSALNASISSLYILTSPDLPVGVITEDITDKIISFCEHYLKNIVLPFYDSSYALTQAKSTFPTRGVIKGQVGSIYNKIVEVVGLFSELLVMHTLTDNAILHLSDIVISSFFVENVSELQLTALKLASQIFMGYEKHRILLLNDILESISRLTKNKISLPTFHLNSTSKIQLLTALVMQLVQCTVVLPHGLQLAKEEILKDHSKNNSKKEKIMLNNNSIILNKYDSAVRVAGWFLKSFLNKCVGKKDEINYTFLFEKFILDLTRVLNKPEWPAAELLLNVLSCFLLSSIRNTSTDTPHRALSLAFLCIIVTEVKKREINSEIKLDSIFQHLQDMKINDEKELEENGNIKKKTTRENSTRLFAAETEHYLQNLLLHYLHTREEVDKTATSARYLYIAEWYKEAVAEMDNLQIETKNIFEEKKTKTEKSKSKIIESSHVTEVNTEKHSYLGLIQSRKRFFISEINNREGFSQKGKVGIVTRKCIDNKTAEIISTYLATKRRLYKMFDVYLHQILQVLTENKCVIRAKAMKCLTSIVEVDPTLLGRSDVKKGVQYSFLDHSIPVREAAVDLVGKYIINKKELIDQYYDTLSSRILDTGISVRKRVIKIFKEVCIKYPDFPKVPEICAKLLRRINDHESIRKLVLGAFEEMWFTSCDEKNSDSSMITQKVISITNVISILLDTEMIFFEHLLAALFCSKENNSKRMVTLKAKTSNCEGIVFSLVQYTVKSEEVSSSNSEQNCDTSCRLIASFIALKYFAKFFPELLVRHTSTLQLYLSIRCQTKGDLIIVKSVAQILRYVVPFMEHPSELFFSQVEEDLMKLILQQDPTVIQNCLVCLSTIITIKTRNYKLIQDMFVRFYNHLIEYKDLYGKDPSNPLLIKHQPYIRRCLFTIGLLFQNFDFHKDVISNGMKKPDEKVFELLVYYIHIEDLQIFSLKSIGFMCTRHHELIFRTETRSLYKSFLVSDNVLLSLKSQVLCNLSLYFENEEQSTENTSQETETLKDIGNFSFEISRRVVQLYSEAILQLFLHSNLTIRRRAVKLIQRVLNYGLIQPLETIPYLICTSTDKDTTIKLTSEELLEYIEKKHPEFINIKAQQGIYFTYSLQKILQPNNNNPILVRGYRSKDNKNPTAINSFLYSLVRSTVKTRRAFISSLLKQFKIQAKESLPWLLYLADNIAYFPYMLHDEPLFIIHQIGSIIPVYGANITASFDEALLPFDDIKNAESEKSLKTATCTNKKNEEEHSLLVRMPEDVTVLKNCIADTHSCLLLVDLREHLKNMYSISDEKIMQYNPHKSSRLLKKSVKHCAITLFTPRIIAQELNIQSSTESFKNDASKDLVKKYLYFKEVFDPDEEISL